MGLKLSFAQFCSTKYKKLHNEFDAQLFLALICQRMRKIATVSLVWSSDKSYWVSLEFSVLFFLFDNGDDV